MIVFEIRRCNQDQLIFHEGFRTHAPVACRAFDETDRNFALEQKAHNLAGVAAMRRELDAGMLSEEGSEQTRENVLSNSGGNSERKLSANRAIVAANLSLGLGGEGRKLVGVSEQS